MAQGRAAAAALLGAALVLAGCSTGGSPSPQPDEALRVGVAYDASGRGDSSFNDAAAAGVDRAELDFGVVTQEAAATAGEQQQAKAERLRGLAADGDDLVIAVGSDYADAVATVAAQYPDTRFALVDAAVASQNVTSLVFAAAEGAFLVGTIAAQAGGGSVGFVGGADIAPVGELLAGFQAGVRAVAPQTAIAVRFLAGGDAGFSDVEGARQAAAQMYRDGAGIVFHAAGLAGTGVFEAARDAGALAIGVDTDQYLAAPDDVKPAILTSMVKRVDTAVYRMIESAARGRPLQGTQTFDLASDGVGYATSNPAVTPYTAVAETYRRAILEGTVDVPARPVG